MASVTDLPASQLARRPRFSLGFVMIYIALLAVVVAPQIADRPVVYNVPSLLMVSAELGILLAYRHASRWVWAFIAAMVISSLGGLFFRGMLDETIIFWKYVVPGTLSQIVSLVGLTMILRELSARSPAIAGPTPAEPLA